MTLRSGLERFQISYSWDVTLDPFLLTHRVKDGLYDIGSRLAPISIRDQMIRAHTLVIRATRAEIIGPDKPLLVVGAGAAGATAAMTAADRGVKTTLIDRAYDAFLLQRGSPTRYLDPTMYDWPADHWDKGEFPWFGSDLPLPWKGGTSSVIGGFWLRQFNDKVRPGGLIETLWEYELENADKVERTSESGAIDVQLISLDKTDRQPRTFRMIISCIGAGPDRVQIGSYRGTRFWQTDLYSQPNLGLPTGLTPEVLISGSGDGALQDFLRIVTNKNSAKDIFLALPHSVRRKVGSFIASKEDHYQRAFTWSGESNVPDWVDDCQIQQTLHDQYTEIVDQLLLKRWSRVKGPVERMLKDTSKLGITLAFECNHFSHCYALNHFLALLLARYIEKRTSKTILYPNTRITKLSGSNSAHHCDPENSKNCEKQPHLADSITADCSTPRPAGIADAPFPSKNPFNVVIVRHGIDWNPWLFAELETNLRHLLPYYSGWGH